MAFTPVEGGKVGRDPMSGRYVRIEWEKTVAALERLAKRFHDEIGRALYQEAEIEMTEAKKRTPVKTGTLRASGHVQPPVYRGREVSVTLAFGGPARGYAIKVHEDLGAWHRVGQAKYLESVINESKMFMAQRVSKRIQINRMV